MFSLSRLSFCLVPLCPLLVCWQHASFCSHFSCRSVSVMCCRVYFSLTCEELYHSCPDVNQSQGGDGKRKTLWCSRVSGTNQEAVCSWAPAGHTTDSTGLRPLRRTREDLLKFSWKPQLNMSVFLNSLIIFNTILPRIVKQQIKLLMFTKSTYITVDREEGWMGFLAECVSVCVCECTRAFRRAPSLMHGQFVYLVLFLS